MQSVQGLPCLEAGAGSACEQGPVSQLQTLPRPSQREAEDSQSEVAEPT